MSEPTAASSDGFEVRSGGRTSSDGPPADDPRISAARRWDVAVLPDVIDAPSEEEARRIFVLTLQQHPEFMHVSEHADVEVRMERDGND